MVKNPSANGGDMGLIPGSGRFPGKEMTALSSTLTWGILYTEKPAATVHEVEKSQT